MRVFDNKKSRCFILGAVLLLSVFLMIFFGRYKLYLYIDETLSYTAANNPAGLEYTLEDRAWYEGEDFLRPLTAQSGHLFDYEMVWRNQISDTHPPVYHTLLHTICSFFPEKFSIWFGISISIFAMVVTAIVGYRIGLLLFNHNRILSLCGMVAYLVSISTITQVMFIRMYVLLQIFTSCILYLHLLYVEEKEIRSWKFYVGLYLVTVLGTMTQYYYLIFAFFLAFGFCVFQLIKKQWKEVIKYVITMAISAGTVLLIFPAILTHLFHKEVGEIAVNNAMNLPDIRLRVATMFNIVSEQIFGGQCKLFIFLAIVFVGVYLLKWIREKQLKSKLINIKAKVEEKRFVSWFLCIETAMFYFITVSLITPYLCDRYLSPIFLIVILLAVKVTFSILQELLKSKVLPYYLLIAFAMIPMINKVNMGLEDTAEIEMQSKAETYAEVPCVVFDDLVSTENFMELSKYKKLYYVDDSASMTPIEDEIIQNADKLVVYIPNDKDVEQYTQRLFDYNSNLSGYERLYVAHDTIAYSLY